jgi:hypothetical protein
MLAWDVETSGLQARTSLLTVATTYSPERQMIYQFAILNSQGKLVKAPDFDIKKEAFMKELDDAPMLAGFNTIGFDLKFITIAFQIPPERVMKWLLKSLDIFEASKQACGRTFGLNAVLDLNGLTSKSGSGMQAVHQANAGLFKELGDYCMDDSRLTYLISTRKRIALPMGWKWRKEHGERTHDPDHMLFMNIGPDYQITFETGTLVQL